MPPELQPASDLGQALANIVGTPNRIVGESARQWSVDQVVPQAIVYPKTYDEMSQVMRLAADRSFAVSPRGGGTGIGLGYPPERLDMVVSTRRLDGIVAYEPRDLTVTVEAGMTLRKLNDHLAQHGQCLPLDAPLDERATIGGILARNVTGARRLNLGTPRDRLIGIRVIDTDGTLVHGGGQVVKNVAGYDLPKMYIGSLGTLGVIVEACFKLAPLPKASAVVVGAFPTLEEALVVTQKVRNGWTRPNALELLNRSAMDYIAPRAGVPSMAESQYFLAVDLTGGVAAVDRGKLDVHRNILDGGGKSLVVEGSQQHTIFWRALTDLGRQTEQPSSMIARCSVLWDQLPKLIHGHEALAESSGLVAALDVCLTAGVIRSVWWAEKLGPADHALLAEAVRTLRIAAGNTEGGMVVENATMPLKRAVDVWGPPGDSFFLMKRLKEQFDPQRRLNPGRFVGRL